MYGLLSQNSGKNLMTEIVTSDTGYGRGTGETSLTLTSAVNPPVSNPPIQNFDISVLSGLKPSDKYLGRNTVSDIQSSYQTYLTGMPVGRGGQYALDAARKYGVSLVEAARGYLVGAGLTTIPSVTQTSDSGTTTGTGSGTGTTTTETKSPFQVLADILPSLFGNAVYNPPLQSQVYGYTPQSTQQPLTQATGGGLSIGLLIIVGVIGVIGYFVYKRFAK